MLDVIIDCVGPDKIFYDAINILSKGGSIVIVGLFGTAAKMPIAMTVLNEYKIFGSLWNNYSELRDVIELLKIVYSPKKFILLVNTSLILSVYQMIFYVISDS